MINLFRHYRIFLITCIWILYVKSAYGQQPYTLHHNTQNGLPSNIVYNLHEDKKGFIWLATNDGLFKYDGFKYQAYRSIKQTSLSGSNIKEDKYGRVWYQNFDGFIYYVWHDKLYALKQNKPVEFISYGITQHHLFVAQQYGVDIYDIRSLRLLKTIPIRIQVAEHSTTHNNCYYLITDDIIYKVDDKLQLTSSNYFEDKKLHVKYIFSHPQYLYILSKHNESKRIYFFDSDLNFISEASLPSPKYIQGSDFINNKIWIHTPNGISTFDLNQKKEDNFIYFPENSSAKVIQDYQHNLWVASVNNGIYIVPDLDNRIYQIHSYPLHTFIKNKSQYLLGTNSGEIITSSFDFKNKEIVHAIEQNLPTYYIYEDEKDQNLIFSNKGFTLISKKASIKKTYNIALKEITRLDDKYYAFAASGIYGLLRNPNQQKNTTSIWDDLFYQHQDEDEPEIARLKNGLRAKSIAFEKQDTTIYVATSIGLFKVKPNLQEEILFNKQSVYATKLLTTSSSTYILNTKGSLYEIGETFINLNKKWGLDQDDIHQIKSFNNELFILTQSSFYRIQNDRIQKSAIDVNPKLVRDFWYDNEKLILLTEQGIIQFPIKNNHRVISSRFIIDHIFVNDKLASRQNLADLNHDSNNIKINFSLLDYSRTNTPLYYKINDDNWTLINSDTRQLSFPSLAPGNYNLYFKIGDKEHPQHISWFIKVPFWKKWWFYLLISVLSITLLIVYYKQRAIKMQRQITLLNEKMELEKSLGNSMLSAIKSQMNPHFFYNALNTIQAYIFNNDKTKASSYLSKFSKLTRNILEMSEKEHVTLKEDLEAIRLYLELEKMRFEDNFHYEIHIESVINTDDIEMPPMLLQPYVENAIKHGLLHKQGSKQLILHFSLEDNHLIAIIEDNGVGRRRAHELNTIKNKYHKSFATEANDKRIQILNKGRKEKISIYIQDLIDSQGIEIGTRVTLTIPLI